MLFISHPLFYVKSTRGKTSYYQLYRNGKLVTSSRALFLKLAEPLLYIKDFFYTLFWVNAFAKKSDWYFGVGNLNAFAGIVLQYAGIVDKTIYYVIDYVPRRFVNRFLNIVYHWIEKDCALKSNWTWNLSPRMIEGREKKWGIAFSHQLVVPHGVHYKRIRRVPFEKVNKTEIIYMGALLKKQGIQHVILALPYVLKRIPKIKFIVIGDGEYRPKLEKLVEKLDLVKHVEFLGYVSNHKEVENRIAQAAIAVAMYELKRDNFTYYTDPGKVRNYLGAGVPVLITDVPYVAKEIEKNKCGAIVSNDKNVIGKGLIDFLENRRKLETYRANALCFAKDYDWDIIFTKTFDLMTKTKD